MTQVSEPYFRGLSDDATEWRDRDDRHAVSYRVTGLNLSAAVERGVYGNGIERDVKLTPVIECQTCGAILREVNQKKHDRLHRKTITQH